ncbi:MAG TPA: hypothetical protein VF407_15145 [Polyangiaceae bacterium]
MKIATRILTAASFASLAFLVACAGTNDKQKGSLSISFPSTAAAIATDRLELHVYDGSDPNACLAAVEARQKGQPQPTPVFETASDTCDFLDNKVTAVDMSYGERAFMVVALRAASQGANQTDFLIGCTRIGIGDVPNTVDVPLTLFSSNVSVPASSKCSTLSAKCSGTICF